MSNLTDAEHSLMLSIVDFSYACKENNRTLKEAKLILIDILRN